MKKTLHMNPQTIVLPDITSGASQNPKIYKSPAVKPFLKWAGGKTNVMSSIIPHVPPLKKGGGCYWEPFVGSGALFFTVKPSNAVLSDVNYKLIECYKAVRENPETIYELLNHHFEKHSSDHFYKTRVEFNSINDKFYLASCFIYLNKAGFNGLYSSYFSLRCLLLSAFCSDRIYLPPPSCLWHTIKYLIRHRKECCYEYHPGTGDQTARHCRS